MPNLISQSIGSEEQTREVRNLSFAEAANAALTRAMHEIPETLLFGEDVALPGGIFGVTKGMHRKFGERVFDMPISESAILGGAVGAAMMGRRPIVEVMWIDFSLVALDQIVNQAANVRYLTRGELQAPITIRTQQASAPGACAQHSQSLEALFTHIPGLQVCLPATAQDAYDLLLSAIYSSDPTIVIENRNLYHDKKSEVFLGGDIQPIGKASIRRAGRDLTVVTWGSMQHQVMEAAELAAGYGVDVEVLDLRWLRPLDVDALLASVGRTRKLIVAHEAHTIGGFGAEIISVVMESGLQLTARPVRVGTPPVRIPAAPSLAEAVIPNRDTVLEAIMSIASFGVSA